MTTILRKKIMNAKFGAGILVTELEALLALKYVGHNFLCNHKFPNFENNITRLLDRHQTLGSNMNEILFSSFTSRCFPKVDGM